MTNAAIKQAMNVRDKLVEILKGNLPHFQNDVAYWHDEHIGELADHLIANGVTVQEWIPVTKLLPDDSANVILCTISRIVDVGFYNKYTRSWVLWYSGGGLGVDVTHWQPLPQPPKGE